MDLAAYRETLGQLDPDSLPERERTLTLGFLALFDSYVELETQLAAERQRRSAAEAEIRRLKGLPEPPDRGGSEPGSGSASRSPRKRPNLSSERERKGKGRGPGRGKSPRRSSPTATETIPVDVDPALLPPDAVAKGYRSVKKQDLRITLRVVVFRLARYHSPSEGKTYQAEVPAGWEGGFGPVTKALAISLAHRHNGSQAGILAILSQFNLKISAGKVSGRTTATPEMFEAEYREVFQAGQSSSPWHQTDMTPTVVNGKPETCQVIGNPTYTHYHTGPGKDRAAVVRLLRAETPDGYLLADETIEYLGQRGWARHRLDRLARHCEPYLRSYRGMRRQVRAVLLDCSEAEKHQFWTAALLMAYRADPALPRVRCLVTDDSAVYDGLFGEMALCWLPELRHLKELRPAFPYYERELKRVRSQAWKLYRELDKYKKSPDPAEAVRLSQRFDRVFGQQVSYSALAETIRRTMAKRDRLLLVLERPEIPLHNNDSELAIRQRVRRRDVSFGPRSRQGARAWDVHQSLAATTGKLGVNYYDYLYDRITQAGQVPRLSILVKTKAAELGLGASWRAPTTC